MEKIEELIINFRRHFHKYPELGNQEYNTSKFIESVLKKYGLITKRYGKTAIVGLLNDKEPAIGLRAEMDALPIQEETGLNFSSIKDGVMHACGHDANMSIVLGSAIYLSRGEGGINVKFIFQPNEEEAMGAINLIRLGVLKNPKVTAIIGMHVNPYLPSGHIGIKYGSMLAGVDKFSVKFTGGGGHAAYPHKGKDTILLAAEFIKELEMIKRKIDPTEPIVISVGKIEGGTRFNIFAKEVYMEGTVRTLDDSISKYVSNLMHRLAKMLSKKYNVGMEFKYEKVGKPLKNDVTIANLAERVAIRLLGKKRVKILDRPSMGGEDFSEYLMFVPGCLLYIGCKKGRRVYPWHHSKFDINEKALHTGALLLKEIVNEYFSERR